MKRFHEDVTTESTTFDCHSLGSSLKRVRISMSPGELRLERDLQYLATHSGWTRCSEIDFQKEIPPPSAVDSSQSQQPQPTSTTYMITQATLSRTKDPLRLVLCLGRQPQQQQQEQQQQQHSTITPQKINITIQLPRMYPHRPPVVSRIVYSQQDGNSSSSIHATHHPTLCPTSTTTTTNSLSSSSIGTNASKSTPIESILVSVAPPASSLSPSVTSSEQSVHSEFVDKQHHYGQQRTTIIYDQWTPVHRLGDLLDFIIQVLSNHYHHHHGDSYSAGAGTTESQQEDHQDDDPKQHHDHHHHMRRQENILALHKQESIRRHDDFHKLQNYHHTRDEERWRGTTARNNNTEMGRVALHHNNIIINNNNNDDDHDDDNNSTNMDEDNQNSLSVQSKSPQKLNITFPHNRFDVGYDRPHNHYHYNTYGNPGLFWSNNTNTNGVEHHHHQLQGNEHHHDLMET